VGDGVHELCALNRPADGRNATAGRARKNKAALTSRESIRIDALHGMHKQKVKEFYDSSIIRRL
jgi:hypothetical protein